MKTRKKLIEVALPLVAINTASAREKSIRHGHPSTLHLWWARRPLAAARAVIFAQMVDDPSMYIEELLADADLRKKAETALAARLQIWEETRLLADKSRSSGLAVVEPGTEPTIADVLTDVERQRLFRIIEELVKWENTTNEDVLQQAQAEILKSWRRECEQNSDHPRAKELFNPEKLPAFHDPFAGGGALPLEAQRLGLESYASDLNPVAVLINKAMIEIPPKFAGRPPVNAASRGSTVLGPNSPKTKKSQQTLVEREWPGVTGLVEDVRYYGRWMRVEAEKRIGHLYPKVDVTADMADERPDLQPYVGRKLTVIAWLWARTVKSPNPAIANIDVPLASTFMLSTKARKEAYVEPIIEGNSYRFKVKTGKPNDLGSATNGTKLSRGSNFKCILTGTPIPVDYVKSEGVAGRAGVRLMAVVALGDRERVYLSPTKEQEEVAATATPTWSPAAEINYDAHSGATWCVLYGLKTFGDLFTPRQLVAVTTFADLIQEVHKHVVNAAKEAKVFQGSTGLAEGGDGTVAYADAICTYLACGVSRLANRLATICMWNRVGEKIEQVFARQAIPMTWDFAEANALSDSTGGWEGSLEWVPKAMEAFPKVGSGQSTQADACTQSISERKVVSTDPPYFDNIGYADLSDFFYVWLRRSLKSIFGDLLATMAVPKMEELIANPFRSGSKEKAEKFFLNGMTRAMRRVAEQSHPAFPVTIYYAFKQSETKGISGTASTGWETFLEAVICAGFAITGTWPIRTERDFGMKTGVNVLASSIVLVCRRSATNAPTATHREFVTALKRELPAALAHLQRGNIAPVDLAQAAIGPGMAVFTRYAKVLDAEGKPLSVREALALINQTLDEALAEQEGDFDADSRWALAWFEQSGFTEGEYGVAETLSTAKNISVQGLEQAGIVSSSRGKVRLLKPEELPADWDPVSDPRLTAWEIVHQLVRSLESEGESSAAALVAKLGAKAEIARELAYRLYVLCERKKRNPEALSYNGLVQSWPEITRLAREGGTPVGKTRQKQKEMYEESDE